VDLLFATGGSGGHIYPALAVARAARAHGLQVAFLGQAGGMEARLVPEAGHPFLGVAAGKWDRQRPDPRQAFRAAEAAALIMASPPAAWSSMKVAPRPTASETAPAAVLGMS